jgi:hypothetical protein
MSLANEGIDGIIPVSPVNIAAIGANTVLGNNTAGTAAPVAMTVTETLALISPPTFTGDTTTTGNFVVPKTSGYGIKVDTASPTFPWDDFIGNMIPDPLGANSPTLVSISGGSCRTYAYTTSDKMDIQIHVTHSYVAGTDAFIHIHWLHNGTAISGNMVATLAYQYGKGHNQSVLTAEKTLTVTYNTVNIATTPQYQTRIDEIQISSAGGSATLIDTADIEPDGIFYVNLTLTTLPTITGGGTTRIFIPYVDIHAQQTGVGTKQKAPNFYV